ncbi:Clp protease N-terminal domain-containing protein [Streptacidiphilus sp. PB12-B1b]|uniref:Clp protease N-terminal domain-containing protein n=1 Tax=Streptacidiphilus sp. PB12-B1b TaxID=2705012 RepID=UPI001CDC3E34|nr:Clp protease N-terminal domain-containing protein [Streptacidiphilus sp. PB12-B1b]
MYSHLYQPELRDPDRAHAPGTLSRVAAGARRRAVRSGDAEVDTGHLLHALLESDDRALDLVAPRAAQAARLMGYLAQRSIGFGRGWTSSEGAGSHRAQERDRLRWSRSAGDALEQASRTALARTGREADALDLLAQLAGDASCRAAEILRGAGVDPRAVFDRVHAEVFLRAGIQAEVDADVRVELVRAEIDRAEAEAGYYEIRGETLHQQGTCTG